MVDLQFCGLGAAQWTEYTLDGSEGTVTVEWLSRKKSIGTTVGCVVKNDKTFRDLTNNKVTEGTKYYAYTCGIPSDSSKAKIRIHRFTKPENEKKCTVDDVVNKKVDFVNHEHIFVPCEEWNFNRSSFLEEYSISVKSPTRRPREVCEDGKVTGLCKEQPKGLLKFFEFEINRQESICVRFCIEESDFAKLEKTGPLLIGHGKSKTLVGYYRKLPSENHITISTFTTNTAPGQLFLEYIYIQSPRTHQINANRVLQNDIIREKQKEMFEAIENVDIEKAKCLIAKNEFELQDAKETAEGQFQREPFHFLAGSSSKSEGKLKKMFIILHSAGCNENCADKFGNTPLMLAAEIENMTILRLLLEIEADVKKTNNEGNSPLHWAAKKGKADAVKLLLVYQANINVQNKEFYTPLHLAVINQRRNVVRLLIDKGADVDLRDKRSEKTPVQYAESPSMKKLFERPST